MFNSYPTVDFSEKLKKISNSKPSLPQAPTKPIKPTEPTVISEGIGCGSSLFMVISICCAMICVISLFTSQFQVALTTGLISVIGFFIYYGFENNEARKEQLNFDNGQRYREKCKKYEVDLIVFNKSIEDYELKIKTQNSVEYIHNYKSQLFEDQCVVDKKLFNYLAKTKLSFSTAAVSFFEPFILKEFTNSKILSMVVLDNFILQILLYEESGIFINIEIDEPYFNNTGVPKNYIDNINGSKYNRIDSLKKQNITTVRFCEEQIFKHPYECVKFISKVKGILLEHKTYIDEREFPFAIPMWTKEKAHNMAFLRYRNSYIPEKYHEMLKYESLNNL